MSTGKNLCLACYSFYLTYSDEKAWRRWDGEKKDENMRDRFLSFSNISGRLNIKAGFSLMINLSPKSILKKRGMYTSKNLLISGLFSLFIWYESQIIKCIYLLYN